MVAVIKTGSSIHRSFNYNENKVKEGVAQCIAAVNYPKDVSQLTLSNKLNRLLNQAALNENVTRNSVHISLNFDPSEELFPEQLQQIAQAYMQKIGFGEQPYLVYQHHDAGHPHVHIVTVKVRADGSRIDMQNIGRNQSEKARKEIEHAFGLIRAEDTKQRQAYVLKPVNVQKVLYGRTQTKRAINTVLDAVLKNYRYASLPELNAVLAQYNVMADRGSENSRVYQNKGLVYRILDEKSNKVGVPIKASDFYNKPTLSFLEEQFKENEQARQPYKSRLRNAIDMALQKSPQPAISGLLKALEKEGIHTVLRQNEDGMIYGVTYVDHRTKCVFNGSALGKSYSAKAIQECCKQNTIIGKKPAVQFTEEVQQTLQKVTKELIHSNSQKSEVPTPTIAPQSWTADNTKSSSDKGVLDTLLQTEHATDYVPNQFKKRGKRKKKKRISKHL
jgi:hypothetical protein